MNLIKINLLPYREIAEQKRKKQFNTMMGLSALLGLGLAAFAYLSLAGLLNNQESRNESLKAGIKQLDAELEKIKELEITKQNYLARKQKVEELDNKRFEAARVIDTLDLLMPDGVYLLSIANNTTLRTTSVGTGNQMSNIPVSNEYYITGKAISDNRVAMLMTSLPSTGTFETPQLVSIRKTDRGQEFVLQSKLTERKIQEVAMPAISTASSPVSASASVPASAAK